MFFYLQQMILFTSIFSLNPDYLLSEAEATVWGGLLTQSCHRIFYHCCVLGVFLFLFFTNVSFPVLANNTAGLAALQCGVRHAVQKTEAREYVREWTYWQNGLTDRVRLKHPSGERQRIRKMTLPTVTGTSFFLLFHIQILKLQRENLLWNIWVERPRLIILIWGVLSLHASSDPTGDKNQNYVSRVWKKIQLDGIILEKLALKLNDLSMWL